MEFSDSECAASSSTSSSSLSSDSGSENSNDGNDCLEKPFLGSVASKEEEEVRQVLHARNLRGQSSSDLGPLREERNSENEAERALPSSSSKGPGMQAPVPAVRGSFCNRTLGLVEASIQKAAKLATCRHCQGKIGRHMPRFGYSYSVQKFHCYLHPACTLPYLQAEKGNVAQACVFLRAHAQDKQHPPELLEAIEKLLVDLKSLPTQ